jgi:hypothetical protein
MEVVESSNESITLRLAPDEVIMLSNALNEICNGIAISEFETRVGYTREEVARLLAEFQQIRV